MTLNQAYLIERKPHVSPYGVHIQPAARALSEARIRVAWEAAGGLEIDEWRAERSDDPPYSGRVRLLLRVDHDPSSAWDVDAPQREIDALIERADREGVCGIVAQFWDDSDWQDVDSVWGFIGSDWKRSGYDTDCMRAALDALADHDAKKAAALEAERPDLYHLN